MTATGIALTDTFGRRHDYLRISLTDKCNLRCTYCMPENGIDLQPNQSYMTRTELMSIAREFVRLGVRKIRLTGGEPLVRKDVAEIIQDLGALGVELAITTNGVLVHDFIDVFKSANVKTINVSLDTFRPQRMKEITRRDNYTRVTDNINLLLDSEFRVKLNAVIVKGMNEDELVDFIEYTRKRPVEFRFIEFMPFEKNRWDMSRCVTHKEMISKVSSFFGERMHRLIDGPNDTARHYRIDGYKGTFAVIGSVTNPFCDTCNRLRLTADGKMKNCLFSGDETDLLNALRSGEQIGDLITDSVMRKREVRAGMNTLEALNLLKQEGTNRPMAAIGG